MSFNSTVNPSQYFDFGVWDYTLFILMLVLSTAVGIYYGFFSKSADTTDEYLMGGKRMKTLPIAISLVASQLSGISIMALPSEIYSFGIGHACGVAAIFVCVPILCMVVIPVFYNNGISNCYQYLEMRFNSKTRKLMTAIFVLNVFLVMPVFTFIPALAFSQVTGVNIHLINGVVCFICVFYTMLGGIKAVVWTDVIQGIIMLSSVVLVGCIGANQVGGFEKVVEYASEGGRTQPNMNFDLTTRVTLWNTFFGGILMWVGYVGFNQSCVQRIVSLPSLMHAKKALIIFGIGFLVISGLNCFIGVILYARYHDCDPVSAGLVEKPDKLMPFFVQDVVGHLNGMPGIFISAVFSAALSTMSANLNTLSGILYFDYVKPYITHTEHKANMIMKGLVFAAGLYCLLGGLVVGKFKSIVQMIVTISGLTHGAIFGIFTLGMFFPKARGNVGFYGILFSIAVLVVVITGAQLRLRSGELKYDPLPLRTDGCEALNITLPTSTLLSTTLEPSTDNADPSKKGSIFDLSFHWYKVLGALCVWILAVPLSFIINSDDAKEVDPKLLSPLITDFFQKKTVTHEELPLTEKIDFPTLLTRVMSQSAQESKEEEK